LNPLVVVRGFGFGVENSEHIAHSQYYLYTKAKKLSRSKVKKGMSRREATTSIDTPSTGPEDMLPGFIQVIPQ
jgi:hypothetical protein